MRRSCSGALQRPCTPPAPPNRPGTRWPPQPSPARSAQENPDVSAHPRGRRDPKRRRGIHRNPAPPAPAGGESPGSGATTMLASSAGNGPHSQVILLCDTLRGTVRIMSNAHCPGETGPCRVAGCGDPGRSKPGGPTPAGYSRSPFLPLPALPSGDSSMRNMKVERIIPVAPRTELHSAVSRRSRRRGPAHLAGHHDHSDAAAQDRA